MNKLIFIMHFAPAAGILLMLIANVIAKFSSKTTKFGPVKIGAVSFLGLIFGSALHHNFIAGFDPCVFYIVVMIVCALFALNKKLASNAADFKAVYNDKE